MNGTIATVIQLKVIILNFMISFIIYQYITNIFRANQNKVESCRIRHEEYDGQERLTIQLFCAHGKINIYN